MVYELNGFIVIEASCPMNSASSGQNDWPPPSGYPGDADRGRGPIAEESHSMLPALRPLCPAKCRDGRLSGAVNGPEPAVENCRAAGPKLAEDDLLERESL